MKINNLFIHYNTESLFRLNYLSNSADNTSFISPSDEIVTTVPEDSNWINYKSIAFIKDTKKIWTHGEYYCVFDEIPLPLEILEGDLILKIEDNNLSAVVKLKIDEEPDEEGNTYIRLLGREDADLGKINISEIAGGNSLENISFDEDTLELVVNIKGEDEARRVDLSKLSDVYDGDSLSVSPQIPETPENVSDNDSLNAILGKLIKKCEYLAEKLSRYEWYELL